MDDEMNPDPLRCLAAGRPCASIVTSPHDIIVLKAMFGGTAFTVRMRNPAANPALVERVIRSVISPDCDATTASAGTEAAAEQMSAIPALAKQPDSAVIAADRDAARDPVASVDGFIRERCEIVYRGWASVRDLRRAYAAWCEQNQYMPASSHVIRREMARHGKYDRTRVGGRLIRGYWGVRLRAEASESGRLEL